MTKCIKKRFVSWSEIDWAVKVVATKLKPLLFRKKFTSIFGIPRGGLIPAVMLSHQLNLPVQILPASPSYDWLYVDDICDSGETLREYCSQGLIVAVLFTKEESKHFAGIYGEIVADNEWLVFPWEISSSKTKKDNLNFIT